MMLDFYYAKCRANPWQCYTGGYAKSSIGSRDRNDARIGDRPEFAVAIPRDAQFPSATASSNRRLGGTAVIPSAWREQ
jgi:hypothetical protein